MTFASHAHLYALSMGSNRPISARLSPRAILPAAVEALARQGGTVIAFAPTIITPPLGPSARRYANSALILASPLPPSALLALIHAIEARFGRRRHRRWGARTLDIDILLWSGGRKKGRHLSIPHPAFATRPFVLAPLCRIAPDWRDPVSGLSVRQLFVRLQKPHRKT